MLEIFQINVQSNVVFLSAISRARNICERYPNYRFSISGIGELPENVDDKLGKCSQMAIFVRKDMLEILSNDSTDEPTSVISSFDPLDSEVVFPIEKIQYELLFRKEFPFDCDTRTTREKMLDDVKYFINRHLHYDDPYFDEERDICVFPVEDIFRFVHDASDLDELRTIIRKEFVINGEDCVESKLEVESDESDPDDDQEDVPEKIIESNQNATCDDWNESWD